MRLATHLSLGRVSNLPTVWTNVLSAGLLAGAGAHAGGWAALLIALSLFYVAGMYYNDACDAEHDRIHQPQRPIPSGMAALHDVQFWAFGYTLIGALLVVAARTTAPLAAGSGSLLWLLGMSGLIGCIIAYDRHHKANPFSPLLMAGCRALVLITAAGTLTASLPPMLWLAIATQVCWLIGLTFIAKQERHGSLSGQWPLFLLGMPMVAGVLLMLLTPAVLMPIAMLAGVIVAARRYLQRGAIGQAVPLMIAGIALVDGLYIAHVWGMAGALLSLAAFALTLGLQRWVSGT